jgi:DNA-binding HxlR family transcriptional regulator
MTSNRDSATTPPLAELFDLLGRRWTLRVLWELRDRTLSFNDLRRAVGGMSQSVLVTRLTDLFGAGLVADVPGGYQLTTLGRSLVQDLDPIADWAARWERD